MEYTKGEWKYRKGLEDLDIITGESTVCYLPNDVPGCEANAQLISMAPRMYEALKDMVDPDDCSLDHHGYCQAHGWLQSGLCPHFRAKIVLAKAEGK